jgi:hypothetical protein
MKLIHEILTASSISALEIKYVTKVKIRRIDYPGYLFSPRKCLNAAYALFMQISLLRQRTTLDGKNTCIYDATDIG